MIKPETVRGMTRHTKRSVVPLNKVASKVDVPKPTNSGTTALEFQDGKPEAAPRCRFCKSLACNQHEAWYRILHATKKIRREDIKEIGWEYLRDLEHYGYAHIENGVAYPNSMTHMANYDEGQKICLCNECQCFGKVEDCVCDFCDSNGHPVSGEA